MISAGSLLKRSAFKKATPSEKIATVVAKLQSTHDAVFVFEKDKFLGVVNLYHSFLGKKFNPEEKVDRCLFHPPVVNRKMLVTEVARLMVESRVYRLPVMEGEQFLGVIFAEDLLAWAKKQPLFRVSVKEVINLRSPVFVDLNTPISQALHLMIKGNTNRVLVEDKNGNLVGILTLYDLRQAFTQPRERISFLMRAPIKAELVRQPVRKFYHRRVISMMVDQTLATAANLLLSHNIGSLVVFSDSNSKKPAGLLVFRDLLRHLAAVGEEKRQTYFSQQFKEKSLKLAKAAALEKINKLLRSNSLFSDKISQISLNIREIAKGRPETRLPLMEVTALVRLTDSNRLIRSKVRGRRLAWMIDELVDKIKTLLRKQKR